jgi:hypothetical protein
MTSPLCAHIDIDAFGELRSCDVMRGEDCIAILTTGEDRGLEGKQRVEHDNALIALCRQFAAVEELLEAVECSEDYHRFVYGNSGTRIEIVAKWLPRIKELLPREYAEHLPHAAWTQADFSKLPVSLRQKAIRKTEGGPVDDADAL